MVPVGSWQIAVIWVNPLAKMGDEDFGLPAAGLPKSCSRSNLPASEAGSAALAGEPASPVPT